MLSYRHAYHAGSFADVHKHLILVAILSYLRQKNKPFSYIDTHAGAGLYPINNEMMQKNKEYQNGIHQIYSVQTTNPLLKSYLDVIRQVNNQQPLELYPGSPTIARHFLTSQDKMHAFELHPADHISLSQQFLKDKLVKIHRLNAYETLAAFVPPPAKRALIMIDPSYELHNEYKLVLDCVETAYQRFCTGIYAIWYPIVDRAISNRFINSFKRAKINNVLVSEISLQDDKPGYGMTGTGMIIINPPFTLKNDLKVLMTTLHPLLHLIPSLTRYS